MARKKTRIVTALGGNAILQQDQDGTYEEQLENVRSTAEVIGEMILSGQYQVVITHGNGPQVGAILLQNDAGESEGVPAMPMDVCGAQSQGMIGYMIQQCLGDVFRESGHPDIPVATLITQVIVDEDDSAFENPSKPVGPFYEEDDVEKLEEERGWTIINDAGRGWRRVVPSPEPVSLAEKEAINKLLEEHVVPIVSGGGGIPVIEKGDRYVGKEAVIDKDFASAKVGEDVDADVFLMFTDVNGAALNYGESNEEWLNRVTIEEMKGYMEEGHFAEGSMKPKVKAAIRFLETGGDRAVIASLDKAAEALKGKSGTEIVK